MMRALPLSLLALLLAGALARATLPKFASNNRIKGTADEYKGVVEGSIAHYGTYTVDDGGKAITYNIEASTFPNFDGRRKSAPSRSPATC